MPQRPLESFVKKRKPLSEFTQKPAPPKKTGFFKRTVSPIKAPDEDSIVERVIRAVRIPEDGKDADEKAIVERLLPVLRRDVEELFEKGRKENEEELERKLKTYQDTTQKQFSTLRLTGGNTNIRIKSSGTPVGQVETIDLYGASVTSIGDGREIQVRYPLSYSAKSAAYTLTAADDVIECTSGTFTLTLPAAAQNRGKRYYIKNSGTGLVTVDGNGSETIDGSLTQSLAQYDSLEIASNGANWIIL